MQKLKPEKNGWSTEYRAPRQCHNSANSLPKNKSESFFYLEALVLGVILGPIAEWSATHASKILGVFVSARLCHRRNDAIFFYNFLEFVSLTESSTSYIIRFDWSRNEYS